MRQFLKFIHVLGAIGMIGAMACLLVMLFFLPEPQSLPEYARMRGAMGAIAQYILLPSLGLTLVGGLLGIAWTAAYHNAGWAWAKLATGILVFEWTLVAIQGPMQRQAETAAKAVAGQIDPSMIESTVHAERASLWIMLAIALLNVALGIWRPRFSRQPQAVNDDNRDTG